MLSNERLSEGADCCEVEALNRVSSIGRPPIFSDRLSGAGTKRPTSPVEEALSQLEKEIATNYELVSMLESKIDVILAQNLEDPNKSIEEGYPSCSSMVRAINQLSASVRKANMRLADIRDRVEL